MMIAIILPEIERRLEDVTLDIPGLRTVADIQKLACESDVVPAVYSVNGKPRYLGRTHRFATRAQRRALAGRDKGCTFTGCTRGPTWCVAHHVRWWSRGGRTDISEMVLVCAFRHRVIHCAERGCAHYQ
jgi:hypothetical protein